MTHRLFLKLCLIIATGVVALFYLINLLTSHTEDGMSYIEQKDREILRTWGKQAESLYLTGDKKALNSWINELEKNENTWVSIATYQVGYIAGNKEKKRLYDGYHLGRSVDWKIHLYFEENPVMQLPFTNSNVSFLIQLPDRMRPGVYLQQTQITMQIIVPAILLIFLTYLLYSYIMKPLSQLQAATRSFSKGNFEVRATKLMGNRHDEFSELAHSFDQMAIKIGEQIISQRQLIRDLSHELRTPLTRLDIALAQEKEQEYVHLSPNIERINRESRHIRKLVEDTLTLAWLENENPQLQQESVDIVDLLDVLVDDARFEFSDRLVQCNLPNTALIKNSSHRAAGQALENILRNALRYTPVGKKVFITVKDSAEYNLKNNSDSYIVCIEDQGTGVPKKYLETIFKPFFRVDKSREATNDSFGLGLALAKRQLLAVRATVVATTAINGGLCMIITFPKV